MAPLLYKGNWRLIRLLSRPLGRRRGAFLSFAGPVSLLLVTAVWIGIIVLGFALVYWPELGSGLQKSPGSIPMDFFAAIYYSGFCLTTLGVGDITPSSTFTRLLTVLEAALGFSLFTLSITYFVVPEII